MTSVRFDRGTLELAGGAPEVPHAIWDPRSETRRVAAYRFSELALSVDRRGFALEGDLRTRWQVERRDCTSLALRPYQAQALASWTAFGRRGVVALPTGAGKTRVALAALFDTGLPTAILCPTKALAVAWVEELQRHLAGAPVGLVGDFVLTAKNGPLGWAYAPNAVFDRNKDYAITVGELEDAIARNCRGSRWVELTARLARHAVVPVPTDRSIDLRTTVGLQTALTRLGYEVGTLDGIPGPKTCAGVVAFQKDHGLVVDGIYGPKTRAALETALADTSMS